MKGEDKMKKFTWQQLFRLQFKTLEKRIQNHFEAYQEPLYIVKVVRVLQIRNFVSETVTDLTPCHSLIREIYFTQELEDKLLEYLSYFQAYFTKQEWSLLWQSLEVKAAFRYIHTVGRILIGYGRRKLFLSG